MFTEFFTDEDLARDLVRHLEDGELTAIRWFIRSKLAAALPSITAVSGAPSGHVRRIHSNKAVVEDLYDGWLRGKPIINLPNQALQPRRLPTASPRLLRSAAEGRTVREHPLLPVRGPNPDKERQSRRQPSVDYATRSE
jgi:hypothetical protein